MARDSAVPGGGFWSVRVTRRGDSLPVEVPLRRFGGQVEIDLVEPQRRDAADEAELQDEQQDVRVEEPPEEPVHVEARLEHCEQDASGRSDANRLRTLSIARLRVLLAMLGGGNAEGSQCSKARSRSGSSYRGA
eukprot:2594310-Prymnesium_polylepis.1